ncbi:GNAT family N-acetyltransferase [Pseudoalteromonas umbrosa]|uniref:GNAT family N-acetyltransferase n=1 Tax=Pseudoalteromonas umbrosa TaxID=3048489 RepID=UPI0024C25DF3|nr:GNAT family N-acetyltransferase [Pseudoalteromonas sp. B95]MDK1285985.1 GNAT family N-acetyltransferase [Pseudoalteromonas sp. B95]
MVQYRLANPSELQTLKSFLWQYGPNEWNYLTQEGVDEEFTLIEQRDAEVLVALNDEQIVGFAVLINGNVSPDYLSQYYCLDNMAFIGDVVVSPNHSGKGIATQLLRNCIDLAKDKGVGSVLIERHEENLASAGMMEKAGFSVIDTFYDPKKRATGSQKSVILSVTL